MKASVMIRFGYVMLTAYLLIALVFWLTGDREHTLMFMAGGAAWVIGLLVWYKVLSQEQEK